MHAVQSKIIRAYKNSALLFLVFIWRQLRLCLIGCGVSIAIDSRYHRVYQNNCQLKIMFVIANSWQKKIKQTWKPNECNVIYVGVFIALFASQIDAGTLLAYRTK